MTVSSIRFADRPLPSEEEALDAYSQVVTSVAERVLGSVASLRISRRLYGGRQAQGSGSSVAITPDGFLVTSSTAAAPPWPTAASCTSRSSAATRCRTWR
jgi:hypothetical protein